MSHFLKVALRVRCVTWMDDNGSSESSAILSRRLRVSAVHITDRDTQGCFMMKGLASEHLVSACIHG